MRLLNPRSLKSSLLNSCFTAGNVAPLCLPSHFILPILLNQLCNDNIVFQFRCNHQQSRGQINQSFCFLTLPLTASQCCTDLAGRALISELIVTTLLVKQPRLHRVSELSSLCSVDSYLWSGGSACLQHSPFVHLKGLVK